MSYTIQSLVLKYKCEFCQQWDRFENDTCGHCGAPLHWNFFDYHYQHAYFEDAYYRGKGKVVIEAENTA